MTKQSRITLAVASVMLLMMFAAPLWNITLEAPQYPEGLGLKIMLTDVQGQKQHDLTNINNLNHYIGMKRIEPDAIPELRIMPWIVGFLIVFGLIAAASGQRVLLYIWTGVFLIVAIAGLVDFWLWAYDYGHNLDTETAAIKVPGMTYQPPILGSKQLLNFTAHSWPALGGWAAFISLAIGFVLSWFTWRGRGSGARSGAPLAAAAVIGLLLVGCRPQPEAFAFGSDVDDFCRMTITDARFATQVVMDTGKIYRFDSIECMSGFLAEGRVDPEAIHGLWVTDSAAPDTLIPAGEAWFVQASSIRSPMGAGLQAFAREDQASAAAQAAGGEVLLWSDLTPLR